jgi:hypothetical protein
MDEVKPAPASLIEFEHATAAVVFALWIAICSAAPELLWRGIVLTFAHGGHIEWLSPMLFGLMSVFFIEPVLEQARGLLEGHNHHKDEVKPWSPLFRFVVGFTFGLASMFMHESFGAFLHVDEAASQRFPGGETAIVVTFSWALVPFAVSLAWQAWRRLAIGIPLGIIAALSSVIAGWLFDWTWVETATTAIPCVAIQGFGYFWLKYRDWRLDFAILAPVTAVVAAVWLASACVFDAISSYRGSPLIGLYEWSSVLVDLRFYVGWCLGLWLVPRPHEADPEKS